jgi:hypothetical protein
MSIHNGIASTYCAAASAPAITAKAAIRALPSPPIGDDKIRVNSSSLDHPLTILPDQGIEVVAIEKKVMVGRTMRSAYWLNHDPTGMVEAGYGPATK